MQKLLRVNRPNSEGGPWIHDSHLRRLIDTEHLDMIETGGNYPKQLLCMAHSLHHHPALGSGEIRALIYGALDALG